MKRILTAVAGTLLIIGMASCSSSDKNTGPDNSALKTNIAKEWALKDGYITDDTFDVDVMYGADIINRKGEEVNGSHFTLRLPKAESYDSLVRTHLVELTSSQTATGTISTNYGVMNSGILTCKAQISNALADEEIKNSINSKISIFTANVQDSYSSSLNVKENTENQAVYVAYIPALFSYYSGKETDTLSLLSFVFIPVKAEILTATVENDTKIYTSEFYDSTSNLQYNWSTSGNIIVDKK